VTLAGARGTGINIHIHLCLRKVLATPYCFDLLFIATVELSCVFVLFVSVMAT
jgi:hypothetical protein